MSPNRRAVSACLFALIALAGVGCSDESASTAPVVPGEAPLALSVAKPRPRVISISAVQLSSIYIPITPSDAITPYTVTVTNPGPKDVAEIYLEGELQPTTNNQPPPAMTFIAACPNPTGVVPRGDCTMNSWIAAGWFVLPGPGTFTLRLVQMQPDGTKKVLDTKTVDVVFVQS